MIKKTFIAALAVSVLAAGAAQAAPRDHGSQDRPGYTQDHRGDHRADRRDDRRDDRRTDRRSHNDRFDRYGRERAMQRYNAPSRYHAPRGYQVRNWRAGERMPAAYYGRGYVIDSPTRYHLRQPGRGQHWVRSGNDAVLAVIATGVIVAVTADLFN